MTKKMRVLLHSILVFWAMFFVACDTTGVTTTKTIDVATAAATESTSGMVATAITLTVDQTVTGTISPSWQTPMPSATSQPTPTLLPTAPSIDDPLPVDEVRVVDPVPFDKTKELTPTLALDSLHSFLEIATSKLVFTTYDNAVVVYDLANPLEPKEILREVAPGYVYGVVLEKNRLYVWRENQLDVWDVSHSLQPVLATVIPREASQQFIPHQDTLYIIEQNSGKEIFQLRMFDMMNLSAPQEQVVVEWNRDIPDTLFPIGTAIYAFYERRLEVVDLANTGATTFLATVEIPGNSQLQIQLVGNYLYVYSQPDLTVFDVSNPTEPNEVSHYRSDTNASYMSVIQNWVYLSWQVCGWESTEEGGVSGGCGQGLEIVDFIEPTQPRYVGVLRLDMPSEFIERSYVTTEAVYVLAGAKLYVLELTEEFLP